MREESPLPHVEHGGEGNFDGGHLIWGRRPDALVEPGSQDRLDRQERQPAVRVEVDTEESSGVPIKDLCSDHDG